MRPSFIAMLVAVCTTFPIETLATGPSGTDDLELLSFDGYLEPWLVAQLGVGTTGRVASVSVDRGDRVTAGQIVASLESSVEEANLDIAIARARSTTAIEAAKVELRSLLRQLAQVESLLDGGAASPEELEGIQTLADLGRNKVAREKEAHAIAQLEEARARARLERLRIVSPIDGVIIDRQLSVGELATGERGANLVTVAVFDPMVVEVILPDSLFPRIHPGSEADVYLVGPISGTYRARVTVVDPIVDAATDTFAVRMEFPNPGQGVPAGLSARVQFRP